MNFRFKHRGAAMAEYVILLGLVAVLCLGAVTAVGTNVAEVFGEGTSALKTVDEELALQKEGPNLSLDDDPVTQVPDEPVVEVPDEPVAAQYTIHWKHDGSEPLPAYVTTTTSGSYRYFTVDLAGYMAAKKISVVPGMLYDATLTQTGTANKGGVSTWGIRTDINVDWVLPGNNASMISGNANAFSPNTNMELNVEVKGRTFPQTATGISARRYLLCNPFSKCTYGDMILDVNIYPPN